MRWGRSDVELGDVFTKDQVGGGAPMPLLYRVVALIDEPVVVLAPLDERDGDDREHYVIRSPLFAEFRRVEAKGPDEGVV